MKIKEFYETIKDEFPKYSYKQIEDVCVSPFKYVRYIFDEGTLDDIQIKHLGKFRVVYPRVFGLKKKLGVENYTSKFSPEKIELLNKKVIEYELRHTKSNELPTDSSGNKE